MTPAGVLEAFLAFCAVAVISGLLVRMLERRLRAAAILDHPTGRGLHSRPTPRGGGLAIVGCVVAGTMAGGVLLPLPGWKALALCVVGAVLVAVVSWRDDVKPVPTLLRFVVHLVAAVLAVLGTGPVGALALPGGTVARLGWVGLPLTVVWIVGLTNAFNFMDGIDGIAAGQAVVAGLGWAALGWLVGGPFVALVGLLLAAASLGFLSRNWPPAAVFMGDVGSAFIGYLLAVMPVLACQCNPRLLLAGAVLVWPFVFDTVFTFLRRLRRGENILAAHRSHLYQRLVIAGWQHQTVSLLYVGLAALGIACAALWLRDGVPGAVSIVVGLPLAALSLWVLVVLVERRGGPQRPSKVASS